MQSKRHLENIRRWNIGDRARIIRTRSSVVEKQAPPDKPKLEQRIREQVRLESQVERRQERIAKEMIRKSAAVPERPAESERKTGRTTVKRK